MALMNAQVTEITGTLSAVTGASQVRVPFVPNGATRFTAARRGMVEAIHPVTVGR